MMEINYTHKQAFDFMEMKITRLYKYTGWNLGNIK